MTVSVPSSPVVLLNNAADPTKTAAAAGIAPSGDGASEGFQQLLAQVAGGILSIVGLDAAAPATSAKPATDTAESAVEAGADGNTLPLLTDLLPPAETVPIAAAKADLPLEQDGKSGADAENKTEAKDDKTTDAAETGIVLLVTPPAQTLPPVATDPALAASATDAAAIASAAAVGALANKSEGGVGGTAGAAIKDKEFAKTSADAGATANIADPADIGTLAVSTRARGDGAAAQQNPNGQESDFDALMKQLDPVTPASSGTPVDTSKVLAPASRHLLTANTPAATVSVPVAAEGWNDAVAEKVMWFSANKINSAEIHLNPPDLGPLQVRISTQQDQATVYFTSQHASVREALDQALPRLRELMNGQGIQLADAGVGGHSSARQQEYRGNGEGQPRSFANGFARDGGDSAEPVAVSGVRAARSAIDAYA